MTTDKVPHGTASLAGYASTATLGLAGLIVTVANGGATPETWKALNLAVITLVVTQGGRFLQAIVAQLTKPKVIEAQAVARKVEVEANPPIHVKAANPSVSMRWDDHAIRVDEIATEAQDLAARTLTPTQYSGSLETELEDIAGEEDHGVRNPAEIPPDAGQAATHKDIGIYSS